MDACVSDERRGTVDDRDSFGGVAPDPPHLRAVGAEDAADGPLRTGA